MSRAASPHPTLEFCAVRIILKSKALATLHAQPNEAKKRLWHIMFFGWYSSMSFI